MSSDVKLPGGIELAAFYFPNFHSDPLTGRVHGEGWTEWEVLKAAHSRFPGHRQPKVPLWGYEDESDPEVMSRKIDLAANSGIGVFLFDWYYYENHFFLESALRNGFLQSPVRSRMKYALMWANHTWHDVHPARLRENFVPLHSGDVTPAQFDRICGTLIDEHFQNDEYWRVDGQPFFSIYDIGRLIGNFGGAAQLRNALDSFRGRAEKAGLPGLHLNLTSRGENILPGEMQANSPDLVETLGFDSVTTYVWLHHVPLKDFPTTDYREIRERYLEIWDQADREYKVPYYPSIMTAWDSSPRTVQSDCFVNAPYPFGPVVENDPELFSETLRLFRKKILERPENQRIFTINAWNEWTEGAYLEPDSENGYAMTARIREVFMGDPEK